MVALDRPGTLGLLEREAEMAQLRAVLDAVRAGMGRLVAVQGEAGIGKTALLTATGRLAIRNGVSVVRARGSELERDAPFGVAVQLFERHVGTLRPDARAQAFRGAARLAAPLFDASPESAEERSLLHGLYWLAANLAEAKPLLLIVGGARRAGPPPPPGGHHL